MPLYVEMLINMRDQQKTLDSLSWTQALESADFKARSTGAGAPPGGGIPHQHSG